MEAVDGLRRLPARSTPLPMPRSAGMSVGRCPEPFSYSKDEIVLMRCRALCFSNLAQAYLNVDRFEEALSASTAALLADPFHLKSLKRRRCALQGMLRHSGVKWLTSVFPPHDGGGSICPELGPRAVLMEENTFLRGSELKKAPLRWNPAHLWLPVICRDADVMLMWTTTDMAPLFENEVAFIPSDLTPEQFEAYTVKLAAMCAANERIQTRWSFGKRYEESTISCCHLSVTVAWQSPPR